MVELLLADNSSQGRGGASALVDGDGEWSRDVERHVALSPSCS